MNHPPKFNERPQLGAADLNSTLWRTLDEHYKLRLASLRAQNDALSKTKKQTAYLRGQIAMIKDLLDLGNESPIRIES